MSNSHEIRYGIDFTELADWAETDNATHDPQTSPVFWGKDARHASQALLKRGRPTLGEDHATGKGHSPRRQLRLDAETNTRLDAMAAETGRSPSDIMRTAIIDYLDAAS